MELVFILVFPILTIALLAFRPNSKLFLGSILAYALGVTILAVRGLFVVSHLNLPPMSVWGDFVIAPAFYLTALNAPLILLLGLALFFVSLLLNSYHSDRVSYMISCWIFILGLAGTFVSDSLILFYTFFEISLIGIYFWIGLFGQNDALGKKPALTRFFLFTLVGSLAMLISIAALSTGGKDLRWSDLPDALGHFSANARSWIFLGFLLAFSIKLPLFGLHGWLRDTYSIAPPVARALLSGVMSKLGAFGLLLLAVYFGGEFRAHAKVLTVIFAGGVLYGALVSLAQKRFLDVVIYASLSHLNLIGLGLATTIGQGSDSSVIAACSLQMLNHGLIMGAVLVFDARVKSPDESSTGLREGARLLAAFLLLSLFGSVSLPGLSSFPAELVILYATFKWSLPGVFLVALGLLISAGALIRSYHRIFLGKQSGVHLDSNAELTKLETLPPLLFALVWIVLGLAPQLILSPIVSVLSQVKP
ncbi:MAG: hypothetical protein K8S54_20690 [Spirochaetia bacterium]|nr:hypothetical protein [Spirochaetia bacterium]